MVTRGAHRDVRVTLGPHAMTRKATTVCLGCGTEHFADADCEVCYARLQRCLSVFKHWPMETSITPAALVHVQRAVERYIQQEGIEFGDGQHAIELMNLRSHIRSYLQHVAAGRDAFKPEPTDEELLA
jgi:hypothetical protein